MHTRNKQRSPPYNKIGGGGGCGGGASERARERERKREGGGGTGRQRDGEKQIVIDKGNRRQIQRNTDDSQTQDRLRETWRQIPTQKRRVKKDRQTVRRREEQTEFNSVRQPSHSYAGF